MFIFFRVILVRVCVHFFVLMSLPPPSATRTYTLFPYTTLLRSPRQGEPDRHAVGNPGSRRARPQERLSRGDVASLGRNRGQHDRTEEHTYELQSLMRSSYAVFCLKKKTKLISPIHNTTNNTGFM